MAHTKNKNIYLPDLVQFGCYQRSLELSCTIVIISGYLSYYLTTYSPTLLNMKLSNLKKDKMATHLRTERLL